MSDTVNLNLMRALDGKDFLFENDHSFNLIFMQLNTIN